ncbi:hypothetical protein [Alishewanella sp. HH-ZS]|uniref:hypothetical protein n=2 Tax=Alishewanella sp. HH-ZS TaxID=1856684 RepID=UPI0008237090|nr:hypothetical protein [Alishewanella sp. HH-ZS]OCW96222.1 hypothetical protein A9165_12860 [Alishewanella sp. HH-ZS]
MFVFKLKVGGSEFYKLEENIFTKLTGKKSPYYLEHHNTVKHHAVCPACNNPLLVINLHVDREYDDEVGKSKRSALHARHVKYSVDNLADYNEEAYLECPYANPSSSLSRTKRKPGTTSDEILELIRYYPDAISLVLTKSLGVIFEVDLFESMLRIFKKEEGHLFRFVNKYNLAYSFAYMSGRQSMWQQKIDIRNSDFGRDIADAVKIKSLWTWVNKKGEIVRKQGVSSIIKTEFYFTDILVTDVDGIKRLQFDFVIEQDNQVEQIELYRRTIPFDDFFYYNLINKRQRFIDVVKKLKL